jgi:hypothetical protein
MFIPYHMYVCMYVCNYIKDNIRIHCRAGPAVDCISQLLLQLRPSGWSWQLHRIYRSNGCNSHPLPRRTSRGSSQPLPHWSSCSWSRPLSRRPSGWSSQQRSSTVLAAVRSRCRAGAAVVFRGNRFTYRFAVRPHLLRITANSALVQPR